MRRIMGVGVGVTTSLSMVFREVSLQRPKLERSLSS